MSQSAETKKETGGPAFPLPLGNENIDPSAAGMTLRDWFAGKAATAEIESWIKEGMRPDYKEIAESCYEFADAMLQARKL